jgi:hypothetical protein
MKTVIRNILALVVGLPFGGVVNMALVMVGPRLVPPPPGVNMSDANSLSASVHLLEPKHFLFPFLAHAVGTLAGAALAYLVAASRRAAFGFVVGAFFLAGGIAAAFLIPAPRWFIAADLLLAYLPMAWLGNGLARRICGEQRAAGGAG